MKNLQASACARLAGSKYKAFLILKNYFIDLFEAQLKKMAHFGNSVAIAFLILINTTKLLFKESHMTQ